jgi:hypothetical protein
VQAASYSPFSKLTTDASTAHRPHSGRTAFPPESHVVQGGQGNEPTLRSVYGYVPRAAAAALLTLWASGGPSSVT